MPRLKMNDPETLKLRQQQFAPLARLRMLLKHETNPARKAELRAEYADKYAAAQAKLGLGKSEMSAKLKAYCDPQHGGAASLARKPRKDKGRTRVGRDGETPEQAQARADWLQQNFIAYATRADLDHNQTTKLGRNWWAQLPREYTHTDDGRRREMPSETTLRRWRAEADPRWALTDRELRRTVQTRARVTSLYPMHLVVADQMICDCHVRREVVNPLTGEITSRLERPVLFHFVDHYSGKELGGSYGWSYSKETVHRALLEMIFPTPGSDCPTFGTPAILWWDNAPQHWSDWTLKLWETIGTTLQHVKIDPYAGSAQPVTAATALKRTTPYEPEGHGFIESVHTAIHLDFEAFLPGYLGGDNKEGHRTHVQRAIREGVGELPEYLTLDQLNAQFDAWKEASGERAYERFGHGQTTRNQLWAHFGRAPEVRRTVPRWEDLAWRWMPNGEFRQVNKEGHLSLNSVLYSHPALAVYKGRKVYVSWLSSDIRKVWVSADDRLVCVADTVVGSIPGDVNSLAQVDALKKAAKHEIAEVQTARDRVQTYGRRGVLSDDQVATTTDTLSTVADQLRGKRGQLVDTRKTADLPDNVVALRPRPLEAPEPEADALDRAFGGGGLRVLTTDEPAFEAVHAMD